MALSALFIQVWGYLDFFNQLIPMAGVKIYVLNELPLTNQVIRYFSLFYWIGKKECPTRVSRRPKRNDNTCIAPPTGTPSLYWPSTITLYQSCIFVSFLVVKLSFLQFHFCLSGGKRYCSREKCFTSNLHICIFVYACNFDLRDLYFCFGSWIFIFLRVPLL